MFVSPAKTDEWTEMPFWWFTRVGQRKHILHVDPHLPDKGAISGVFQPTEKHSESLLQCMQQENQ